MFDMLAVEAALKDRCAAEDVIEFRPETPARQFIPGLRMQQRPYMRHPATCPKRMGCWQRPLVSRASQSCRYASDPIPA